MCADATEEQTMPSELLRVQGSVDNHQFVNTKECTSFNADSTGTGTCVMNCKETELGLHFQQYAMKLTSESIRNSCQVRV
jgi:hypothetical protein